MSKDTRSRVNAMQTHVLCTFFEENPEVIKGYKRTPEGIDAVQNKWKKISKQLNSLGPARDYKAWAKYLCDMKAKLKRKSIKWKQNSSGTGPIMCNTHDFNEIKLRMLQVLRKHPELHDSHESSMSDIDLEDTKGQDEIYHENAEHGINGLVINPIMLVQHDTPPPHDHGHMFVNQNEYNDEFETFGKNVAQQLRTMPLPVALDTQEMLLSVLKKQRLKLVNGSCNTDDPLDKH